MAHRLIFNDVLITTSCQLGDLGQSLICPILLNIGQVYQLASKVTKLAGCSYKDRSVYAYMAQGLEHNGVFARLGFEPTSNSHFLFLSPSLDYMTFI
jgi:hypothetical protein